MRKQDPMLNPDTDIEYKYYFEVILTQKCQQTNNEAEAWSWFHACLLPCELFEDDHIIGEKFFEDPETMNFQLITEIYSLNDRVDLEEVEA